MKKLLASLNPEQRRAVETIQGPVLVLAGAGTGKTRVITYRIAHLLQKGVSPEAILAMTFTNKAAGEMRTRIASLVGKRRAEGLTVGTFHAFGLRLLRANLDALGWAGGFTIADSGDQLALCKTALRELHIPEAHLRPRDLQARISLAKNKLLTPEGMLAAPGDERDELTARAWMRYQEALERSRRVDFDDLLLKSQWLLSQPEYQAGARARWKYVLVDEYQDTNGPQFELVRAIAGGHKNLCVVGDDDQSIYGWRGADISKILGFEKTFPGATVVRLETNYRSTEQVIGCANKLIKNNLGRHEKTLRSALGPGDPVQAVTMRDEDTEAELIVKEIDELVQQGHHLDEFAVLFRTAVQARPFEAELRIKGVPYVLVGGQSFFDRKEVRDVMAYLRLVANARDETSLLRIVNCPPRGIGKTSIQRALEFATGEAITAAEAFERADEAGLPQKAGDTVRSLLARLRAVRDCFPDGKSQLVPLVQRVIEEVAYRDEVSRCYPDAAEREKRWEGVEEVLNFAENYARKQKKPTLIGFLNELTLTANDTIDGEDASKRLAVTLMTLHASKGLEYDRVFLVGLEEGLLPHTRAAEEDTIEEERRLAYVGITRARKALMLTWSAERARGGKKVQRHPSRFLLELQDKEPPADWVPAGAEPQQKKKAGKKRRRRAARR